MALCSPRSGILRRVPRLGPLGCDLPKTAETCLKEEQKEEKEERGREGKKKKGEREREGEGNKEKRKGEERRGAEEGKRKILPL